MRVENELAFYAKKTKSQTLLTSEYSGTTTGSPTVTTNGSDTVIKFTSSGTYTT